MSDEEVWYESWRHTCTHQECVSSVRVAALAWNMEVRLSEKGCRTSAGDVFRVDGKRLTRSN